MPIKPKKIRLFRGQIDPSLILYVDARYANSFISDETGNVTNLANSNTNNTGNLIFTNPIWDSEEEGAFVFETSSNFIRPINNTIAFGDDDELTIAALVKPSVFFQNFDSTILNSGISNNSNFSLSYDSGRFIYGGAGATIISTNTYEVDKWYQITVTKTKISNQAGSTHRYSIYINGILEKTGTGGNNGQNTTNFTIGRANDGMVGDSFKGKISYVKVWRRALSAPEVNVDYVSSQIKPFTLGSKVTDQNIILFLNERGTSTGWGDNSVYSNGARLLNGAQFDNGLILSNPAMYAAGTLRTDPGQNFTISSLFTCIGTSTSGYHSIFSINTSSGSFSPSTTLLVRVTDDLRVEFVFYNSGVVSSDPNVFQKNVPTHFAVTVSQSGGNRIVKLFVNGVLVKNQTVTVNFNFSTRNYKIGRWQDSGQFVYPFNGKINDVVVYKRTLSDNEVNELYHSLPTTYRSSESTYNQIPTSDRIFYVDAAEPTSYYLSGLTFSDISGFGRYGVLSRANKTQGVLTATGSFPEFKQFNGGYLSFNGFKTSDPLLSDQKGNSYISFTQSGLTSVLPGSNSPSTIIAWARASFSDSVIPRYIFSYGVLNATGQNRFVGIVYPDKFSIGGAGQANNILTLPGMVRDKWFQIAFVYKGTQMQLFANGQLLGIKNTSLNTATGSGASTFIGRSNASIDLNSKDTDGYFYGDIAQVLVYNRSLTEQEIYQHYKTTKNRFYADEVERPVTVANIFAPQVLTIDPNENTITSTSIQTGVVLLSNGNASIVQIGFLWRVTPTPSTAIFEFNSPGTNLVNSSSGVVSTISGLNPTTSYQVRAYAYNGTQRGYGEIIEVTTNSPAILTVVAVTASFTGNFATASGQVTDLGSYTSYVERGFVWSTSTINVSTADSLPTRVSETNISIPLWSSETEVWKLRVPATGNLTPNTRYHLRAFAKAATSNIVYSANELVFTTYTFATVTVTIPTLASDITGTTAKITGNVTNSGGQTVIQRGIVWVQVPSASDNTLPTLETDSETNNGTGTGTFVGNLTGLTINTYYNVRAYAITVAGIAYSSLDRFRTDSSPTVITEPQTNLLDISTTLNGTQTDDGGSAITQRGFIWISVEQPGNLFLDIDTLDSVLRFNETTPYTPTYVNLTTNLTVAAFSSNITGLTKNKQYAFRAYSFNGVDYGYGEFLYFTTLDYALVTTGASSNASTTQVTLAGSITSLGNAPSGNYGFYVGVNNPPLTKNSVGSITSTETLPFIFNSQVTLTGFSQGDTVFYRAFVDTVVSNPSTPNPNNDFVGSVLSFTIPVLITPPSITIGTVSVFATQNTGRFRIETSRNVANQGTNPITEKGAVWAATSPTVGDNKSVGNPSSGNGLYAATFSETQQLLSPSVFQVRAFARTDTTTYFYTQNWDVYAHRLDCTLSLNGVNIDATGTIASTPLRAWILRGFVWNTTGDPKVENGDTKFEYTTQQSGNAAFTKTSLITNVNGNTTYYVRAYMKSNLSSSGLSTYIYSLVTKYPEGNLPTVTVNVQDGAYNTVTLANAFRFRVSYNVQPNGNTDDDNGIVWSTSQNPTIDLATKQSNGSGAYSVTNLIYTPTLQTNATYYFRAYTVVGGLATYSPQFVVRTNLFTSFTLTVNGTNVTANANMATITSWTVVSRGFVYTQLNIDPIETPDPSEYIDSQSIFGQFSTIITTSSNAQYKVRAYVDLKLTSTNDVYRHYSDFQTATVTIASNPPTLSFSDPSDLFVDSTVSNPEGGIITFTGLIKSLSNNPTSVGIQYSNTSNFTNVLGSVTQNVSNNNDVNLVFSNQATGITINVSSGYYVRAFASNSAGTSFSPIFGIYPFNVKINSITSSGALAAAVISYTINNPAGISIQQIDLIFHSEPITILGQSAFDNTFIMASNGQNSNTGTYTFNTGRNVYKPGFYGRISIKLGANAGDFVSNISYSNQIITV